MGVVQDVRGSRELVLNLTRREIKGKYKRTFLGQLWSLANPLAQMLSFSMLLRYSFDMNEDADLIETAVENVLKSSLRTGDIMSPGMTAVSTTKMTDAILAELDKQAA